MLKVNSKAHSQAINKLCDEIEPDIDESISDSSVSDDSGIKMLTYDEQQMEIDYPFMDLINPEYEYTYVP